MNEWHSTKTFFFNTVCRKDCTWIESSFSRCHIVSSLEDNDLRMADTLVGISYYMSSKELPELIESVIKSAYILLDVLFEVS